MAICASTKEDESQITECVKRLIEAGASVNPIDRSELYWFAMSLKTYHKNAFKQQFKIYTITIVIHCHLEVSSNEVDPTNFCRFQLFQVPHDTVNLCGMQGSLGCRAPTRTTRVTQYVAAIYRFWSGRLKHLLFNSHVSFTDTHATLLTIYT